LNNQCSLANGDPFQISIEKSKNISMGLILQLSHLTSTATPFNQMNLSRNGNKWSSIEINNKRTAVIKYQEWLNVISTLGFGGLIKILFFRLI
jgi:hypothetical protein